MSKNQIIQFIKKNLAGAIIFTLMVSPLCVQAQTDKEMNDVLYRLENVLSSITALNTYASIKENAKAKADIKQLNDELDTLKLHSEGLLKSFIEGLISENKRFLQRTNAFFSNDRNALTITTYQNELIIYQNRVIAVKESVELFKQTKYLVAITDTIDIRHKKIQDKLNLLFDTAFIDSIVRRHRVTSNPPVIYNIDSLVIHLYDTSSIRSIITQTPATTITLNQPSVSNTNIDSSTKYIGVAGFENSLYSVFYYHVIFKELVLGGEVVFPVNSPLIKKTGAFILSGFRNRNFLINLGLGWIEAGLSNNIAWKTGATYLSNHIGIGLSYSPLTGTGANLTYRF